MTHSLRTAHAQLRHDNFVSGIRTDIFVSALIGSVGALVSNRLDLFERFCAFTRAYERYELDEVLLFLGLACFVCGVSVLRRWRTEQMVSASEAHYQMLFERGPQPMLVYDRATLCILDVNQAAVRQYGYTRNELREMSLVDLRPDAGAVASVPVQVGEARLVRHRTRDGILIDVEIRADDIEFGGRPARLVLANDVTDSLRIAQELERSASLRRATLEATADGIVVFDRDARVTEWNAKLTEVLRLLPGLDDRATVSQALETMFDPANGAAATSPDHGCFDQIELPDGRVIERYAQPQRLAGAIVGSVWSIRDVTQRERAIAQRRVLASQFESAFGAAPIGMCLVASDGRWIQVNDAMCHLLGRERDALVGRASDWFTHPDDRARTAEEFAGLRSGTARTVQFEKRYLHSDGTEILALVNATRIATTNGAECVVSQVQDITERRRNDEVLRRQALLFETITDAVIMCDVEGRIVDANSMVTTLYGYERDELIGQTPRLWQRGDAAQFELIGGALRTDGEWAGEYVFVRKNGTTGIVETTVRGLRAADGSITNFLGVMRDVTERREMERHLLQAQKLEAIGSLAAGIAHEINTPTQYVGDNIRFLGGGIESLARLVNAAVALADAAREQPALTEAVSTFDGVAFELDLDYLLAELPTAAEQSREGCDRIAEIVQAMKRFSHPGSSKKNFVDLNELVANTVTVSRNEWKYVATLTMDLDSSIPHVPCFPGELQQVVLNIIVNATHAIVESRNGAADLGHIVVSTQAEADWVELRIADDGCGIPEANRGKIFDPFFTTKRIGQGTGQGLSIGHTTIVDKHHGMLTFDSEVGRGTTFIIRLPLDAAETEAAA